MQVGSSREESPTCIPRLHFRMHACPRSAESDRMAASRPGYGINVRNSETAATRIMTIPCTSIATCHLPPLPPVPNCSEYNEDHAGSRPNGRDTIPPLYRLP